MSTFHHLGNDVFLFRSDIPADLTRINNLKLYGYNSVEFKEPILIKDDCKVYICKALLFLYNTYIFIAKTISRIYSG